MHSSFWPLLLLLVTAMIVSVLLRKLTIGASLAGGIIAIFVFLGAGYTGIAMMAAFFIIGSAATSWKATIKESLGIAERNKGQRKIGQVIANSGVAGILGLLIWQVPAHTGIFQVMMAASLASAASDTLSSEMGNIYGRRFYNILNFEPDRRGENGVVSLEGTAFGVLGAMIIAAIYSVGFEFNINVLWISVAGTAGNLADSVLGATLERRNYLSNDVVNFLNTASAAIAAFFLCILG